MSFAKLLIANRGDNGCAAAVAAQPERMLREAQSGDLAAMELLHV